MTTRESILEAALQAYAQHGSAARMEDVADAAGISRQSVYLHFKSRSGLLVELVRYIDQKGRIADHVQQLVDAPDALAALEIAIAAPGSYYPLAYPLARLFMSARYDDDEIREAWDDRMQARREICGLLVCRLAEEHLLSPDWDEETATDILWEWCSWQTWEQLVVGCGWSQERFTGYLRTVVYRLLVAESR